ncbi:ribokinase [Flexivirga endophytica]|uniref:Ribokinase n=1 Tax=Flexivirga endophytica TaxID=1849103 RepID=A0A916TIQ0_9MICO|nr:carbohydrate kinase [Flexivirga endophytica]GGB45868.1 ribokinase [Flexivirga endophytica]GHB66189.1 ribokinase [Flexivirga endophytica]
MVDTLVVGEALIDIVRPVGAPTTEHVGGSPLNVAIGLARLGHPARLAAYFANDTYGDLIARHLAADDVALVEGSLGAERTPTAAATLDETGSATYEFDLAWDLPYPLPTDIGHLHTGSIAAALQPGAEKVAEAMLAARDHATVSFDPNPRPTLIGDAHDVRARLEQLIGYSDVVKASDEDIAWLYGAGGDPGQVLALWGQLGPSLVVMTRGGDGALMHVTATGETESVAGRSVSVVDTVGAGDSFQSGLLSGLLDSGLLGSADARSRLRAANLSDLRPAVDRAIETSAITVSRAGANPPSRAELR